MFSGIKNFFRVIMNVSVLPLFFKSPDMLHSIFVLTAKTLINKVVASQYLMKNMHCDV